MRRLFIAVAMLMLIPAVATAGGGGVDTSGCAGYREGTDLSMKDSCFAGTAHFAPSGTTLTVSNDGELPHTFTAVDGSFDTGEVASGNTAQLSVDEPGIYRVFCSLHGTAQGDGMAGVLVVGDAVPASVAAPADTSAISAAVAAETDGIIRAVESQQSTLRGLNATEAKLLVALDRFDGETSAAPPQVITVGDEVSPVSLVVLLVVGLATGLALSALLMVLRLRIAGQSLGRLDRLEPSAESQ
ncbi:MAG TPA: hypothetical protein VF148_15075 [Acidimicrobiia bacterium]